MATQMCETYGHNWEFQQYESLKLPSGMIFERCSWCDKTQVVREAFAP